MNVSVAGDSIAHSLSIMDGSLYFAGVAGANVALYRSDGTPAGTSVVDYAYHAGGSDPGPITAAGNHFYFSAYDGIYGRELWVSDGSLEGTRQVKDIRPGIYTPRPFYSPSSATPSTSRRVTTPAVASSGLPTAPRRAPPDSRTSTRASGVLRPSF